MLAIFQYRWLGQISDGERGRMNALLHSAASQFTQSFDGEISRIYSIFQYPKAGDIDTLAVDYARRFGQWEASTSYAKLVRDVFLVTTNEQGAVGLMRLNRSKRSLEHVEWPPELAPLQRGVTQPPFDVIWEEIPALVIPPEDSLRAGSDVDVSSAPHLIAAIIWLDSSYIKGVFIPALMSRYFPAENGRSYDLAIVTDGSPRKTIFQSNPELSSNKLNAGVTMGLFDLRLESGAPGNASRNLKDASSSPVLVRIIRRNPGDARPGEELGGRWRLLVNYQPGSLEKKIASSRGRNLAISIGTLILLAASIAMLLVSSARATRLAQDQMKFLAGVTHELRTPLAVICSAADNLADGVVNDSLKIQEYGTLIRDDARRLARMVEQVLKYAGAQSGRADYEFRDADVSELCTAAMADFRDDIAKANYTVDTSIEPNLPPIMADAPSLKRALQNLISNAIKYDNGQRWIGIRARRSRNTQDGDEVEVTVADRGRGIPKSELPHIFEPFYRGRDTTAAQIQGSGLGLGLVQHTIAAHGGRVTVQSVPGQGSSFTIHLPVAHSCERFEET
ncbi:MAG: HAMP domain-containing histidine kinase [Verrucomicrobia bacterium]|nr:HAMP domain-containing histidine kinase [Verrucomicrobiota bacterium]